MSINDKNLMEDNTGILKPEDFSLKMKEANTIVLDVRTLEEYNLGHIDNAVLMDYKNDEFKNHLSKLEPSKTYLVYCRTGTRSASTIEYLKNLGFKNLYDLDGGITHWLRKELPIIGAVPDKTSEKEYQEIISSAPIVIIDFFAPWCGSCTKMEPIFTELTEKYKEKIKIVRINADENRKLTHHFMKRGFPILLAYKEQELQWDKVGFIEQQQLIDIIENLIK